MPAIERILAWEGLGFVFLVFAAAILHSFRLRAATGKGLLEGSTRNGVRFSSPGRVQLLIATGVAALQYLSQVIKAPDKFPDIHNYWLLLFGGSQAIYLGGKYFSLRDKSQ